MRDVAEPLRPWRSDHVGRHARFGRDNGDDFAFNLQPPLRMLNALESWMLVGYVISG